MAGKMAIAAGAANRTGADGEEAGKRGRSNGLRAMREASRQRGESEER